MVREKINMDKKCKNCVFCKQKSLCTSYVPNDFTCNSIRSKWCGYWPYGEKCCEYFTEPTGISVEEAINDNERLKAVVEGFTSMMGEVWGKSREELIYDFMNQDAAVLVDCGIDGNEKKN